MLARRIRPAAVAAAALLAAGCGSTVSSIASGPGGVTTTTGDGLTVPGQTGSSAAPGTPVIPGSTGVTGTGPTTGDGGTYGGTPNGPTGTGPSTGPVPGTGQPTTLDGPGVTPTKIYVGMVYAVNGDALNKAAGANGITSGDERADGNAVIDAINKAGGVAGRKLVPVWQQFDALSSETLDQQWGAICAHFTEDNPRVFAVEGQGVASYRACIAHAGVVEIDSDLPDISDAEFDAYPGLFELGYPRLSRVAEAELASLAAQKYFTGWDTLNGKPGVAPVKTAILTYDDPAFKPVVQNVLIPGLRKLGYDPGADVAYITPVHTASDYSSQASAVQAAELKFASDHVTHVVDFEGNGGLNLFFMNQAESQHYHPRYGVNSASGLEVLIDTGDVRKDQAVGAEGFGWIPGIDLTSDRNPDNGPYSSKSRRDCLKVYKQHGITFADANSEGIGLGYCSSLYFLQRSLNRIEGPVNEATFIAAANTLGSSYDPAGSLGINVRSGRHDGVSQGYYWDYFADCKCMHYTGRSQPVP